MCSPPTETLTSGLLLAYHKENNTLLAEKEEVSKQKIRSIIWPEIYYLQADTSFMLHSRPLLHHQPKHTHPPLFSAICQASRGALSKAQPGTVQEEKWEQHLPGTLHRTLSRHPCNQAASMHASIIQSIKLCTVLGFGLQNSSPISVHHSTESMAQCEVLFLPCPTRNSRSSESDAFVVCLSCVAEDFLLCFACVSVPGGFPYV